MCLSESEDRSETEQKFALNNNFSYITGSILSKLHMNDPQVTLNKID